MDLPSLPASELAKIVKEWRGKNSAQAAAHALGLPVRTLNGIEQGRGFRYPRLLIAAMESERTEMAMAMHSVVKQRARGSK
jgi:hypothetical protein